jgi:alanine racemase
MGMDIPLLFLIKGRLLLKGEYASIVGRIYIDQLIIDVTDIPDIKVDK